MRSRWAGKQGQTGEYPSVLHNVLDSGRLIEMHNTPCTIEMAEQIIQAAIIDFQLSYLKDIVINERVIRGSANHRIIKIPAKQMAPGDRSVIGRCRIGVVLHELAHTLHFTTMIRRYGSIRCDLEKVHGKEYCAMLSMLMTWYDCNYAKRTARQRRFPG